MTPRPRAAPSGMARRRTSRSSCLDSTSNSSLKYLACCGVKSRIKRVRPTRRANAALKRSQALVLGDDVASSLDSDSSASFPVPAGAPATSIVAREERCNLFEQRADETARDRGALLDGAPARPG